MQNPYEVLGIKEGASQEEIKAAYREQVKKYHPDKYQNNPLYELAEEKLREVNEAYDYLMKNGGGTGKSYSNSGQSSYSGGASYSNRGGSEFAQIRKDLDAGRILQAEQALERSQNRCAEWFFLRGVASLRRGWYDDALTNLQTAVRMEPQNYEYNNALNSIMQTTGGYRNASFGRGYNSNNDEMCRMCQCLICLDCLTDC